jgi:hypothetical protein
VNRDLFLLAALCCIGKYEGQKLAKYCRKQKKADAVCLVAILEGGSPSFASKALRPVHAQSWGLR